MKRRTPKKHQAAETPAVYATRSSAKVPIPSTVKIAEFKAKLSQYLREVKAGHPLTLMERDTPVAQVVPYKNDLDRLKIRKATRSPKDVKLSPPLRLSIDPVQYLLEDRNSGR